jgi:hypothetical protein
MASSLVVKVDQITMKVKQEEWCSNKLERDRIRER